MIDTLLGLPMTPPDGFTVLGDRAQHPRNSSTRYRCANCGGWVKQAFVVGGQYVCKDCHKDDSVYERFRAKG